MAKYSVIIAAAGKSDRFEGSQKKTFAKLDGRPVFLRTLEHFMRRDDVCQTILAVAPEDMASVKQSFGPNLAFMGVKLVEGGASRCATVAQGLQHVDESADFVAIHDAARPCVADALVDAVFAEALKSGAAILAAPLTGTIKRVADSMTIDETVSREGLYEAQTPQVFRKKMLLDAYDKLDGGGEGITDDAQVVERAGGAVAVVKSDALNLKVTTKSDLALANAIIKSRPSKPKPRMGAFEEAQW